MRLFQRSNRIQKKRERKKITERFLTRETIEEGLDQHFGRNVNVNIWILLADSYSEGERERKERGSHARHIGIHAACILRPYSAILHIEHPCLCMRVYIYTCVNRGVKKERTRETERKRERKIERDPRGEAKDGKRRKRRRRGKRKMEEEDGKRDTPSL